VILVSGLSQTTYTATALTTGNTYKFKIQTRNSYGLSAYSTEVSILCATVPSIPATPTTTVLGDQVVINWNAPSDNGTPITSYTITFRKSDNTYTAELTNCNGAHASIVATSECTIPLSVFTAAPFNLAMGANINAKLLASNAYGSSSESTVGGGAVVLLVGHAPVGLSNVPGSTFDDRIGL
jgi:hypothetical protein